MQKSTLDLHQFKAVFVATIVQPSFNGALASNPAALMHVQIWTTFRCISTDCNVIFKLVCSPFLQENRNICLTLYSFHVVQPSFNGALACDPAALMHVQIWTTFRCISTDCNVIFKLVCSLFLQENRNFCLTLYSFHVVQPSFNGALACDPAALMHVQIWTTFRCISTDCNVILKLVCSLFLQENRNFCLTLYSFHVVQPSFDGALACDPAAIMHDKSGPHLDAYQLIAILYWSLFIHFFARKRELLPYFVIYMLCSPALMEP